MQRDGRRDAGCHAGWQLARVERDSFDGVGVVVADYCGDAAAPGAWKGFDEGVDYLYALGNRALADLRDGDDVEGYVYRFDDAFGCLVDNVVGQVVVAAGESADYGDGEVGCLSWFELAEGRGDDLCRVSVKAQ